MKSETRLDYLVEKLRADNVRMLAALELLLPVAMAFERQASKGSGGRRGGTVFEQARAAIAAAKMEDN